jgi:hypothetical protein
LEASADGWIDNLHAPEARAAGEQIDNPSYADFWPSIADIPTAPAQIAAHRPIMTLLAAGHSRKAVLDQLQSAAARWNAKF